MCSTTKKLQFIHNLSYLKLPLSKAYQAEMNEFQSKVLSTKRDSNNSYVKMTSRNLCKRSKLERGLSVVQEDLAIKLAENQERLQKFISSELAKNQEKIQKSLENLESKQKSLENKIVTLQTYTK